VSSAKEEFFKTSGPLLTTGQLAKILSRCEKGLRISLRSDTEFSRQINAARKRFDRRDRLLWRELHSRGRSCKLMPSCWHFL
jgi:hypothetical protein